MDFNAKYQLLRCQLFRVGGGGLRLFILLIHVQNDDFDAEAAYDEMIRQEREAQAKKQQVLDDEDDDNLFTSMPLDQHSPTRCGNGHE